MKYTLAFVVLFATILFFNRAGAQAPVVSKLVPKVTLGIKAGANFQTLTGDQWTSTYKPGIVGGGFVAVTKGKWGVESEALIKSARFDFKSDSDHVNALYLDVPVLLTYRIVKRLWVQVGPQFSDMLSAKNNSSNDVKNYFKSTAFSGVLGLQVNLPLHLVLGARYILGVTDVNEHYTPQVGTDAWRNRYAQLYVGFRFL